MKKRYTKTQLQELNYKWKKGNLSPSEQLDLEEWEKNLDDETLHLPEEYKDQPELIRERITLQVISRINKQKYQSTQTTKLWPKITLAAAVAAMIISAGIWFLKNPGKENPVQQSAYLNDVAPGKQGATLTLANGKKIRLTDAANGELAKEAGVVITKTASGQLIYEIKNENTESDKINILTTENGETYQVRLPDGSSVWLNAASTLKYPASFAKLKDRRVELSGEGYFEIAKDKLHPFIVETNKQVVEVLGTHFNINAYQDEPTIATTLIEGSVKVTTGDQKQIIKPGEQAVNNGATIKIAKVNIDNITDWKDGDFNFERTDFKSVMRKISRWYDVEVIYDEGVPDDIESLGWVSRQKSLSNVLKAIENSGQVHFRVEGRKLYVSK